MKKLSKPFDYNIADGITQSMLCDFLTCRQKSKLKLDRWEGILKRDSQALLRGDYIHFFLETYYKNNSAAQAVIGEATSPSVHEGFFSEWCKKNKHDESNSDILPIGDICSVILPEYLNHWKKSDVKFTWKQLEYKFDVTWKGYRLRGKIDGILEVNKQLYIFETKTKAQIEEEGIMDKLQFDFQNFFYLMACRDLLNIPAKGVIYNIIRWPNSRLKKDLASHIREDPSHYFKRYEVAYSLKDVEVFRNELINILHDFAEWRLGHISHYKNPSACFNGNMKCEFLKFCSSGTSIGFSKSRTLFRELL